MNQLPPAKGNPNWHSQSTGRSQSIALRGRPAAVLAAVALGAALAGCGSSSSVPAAAPAAASSAAAKPAASCKLKTTFDYIERDSLPGASVLANEIGNVDLVNCTPSLSDFTAQAGQASGECTTIALASSNPGYDANKVPAAPLKGVIESAGPGC